MEVKLEVRFSHYLLFRYGRKPEKERTKLVRNFQNVRRRSHTQHRYLAIFESRNALTTDTTTVHLSLFLLLRAFVRCR